MATTGAQPTKPAAPARPNLNPMHTAELLGLTSREFILLVGKDGAGKSCALVSLAWWVQNVLSADARFYVIDTENKFPTALRSFGSDAPTNIIYYATPSMNDVTNAMDAIMAERRAGDWLAVESMGRVWERAQDMGYQAVSGFDKVDYLEKRRNYKLKAGETKGPPVIPKPDDFWNVVKGAHDGAFVDLMVQASSLNVILSTTISKPPKADAHFKENATRKEVRLEFGLDMGLDGAPRLPTYVETLCMLDLKGGAVSCRVVRDNLSANEDTRPEFLVEGKKTWATNFWSACR